MKKVIIITGLSGVGKTHYAERAGLPFISYDDYHDYDTQRTDLKRLRNWLEHQGPTVMLDAWGFCDELPIESDVEIRFLYTTMLDTMLSQRQKSRIGEYKLPNTVRDHYALVRQTALTLTGDVSQLSNISWVFRDGSSLSVGSEDHLSRILSAQLIPEFLAYVSGRSGDSGYQTIELDGEVIHEGYMLSHQIWNEICQLDIDWGGKAVADLGSFNGYFSFKAEQAGASVIGYDVNEPANEIATCLGLLGKSSCQFITADLNVVSPKSSDVLLILNVLHHIADGRDREVQFLRRVLPTCKEAVLLVNPEQVPATDAIPGYRQVCVVDSHLKTELGQRKLVHYRGVG